MSTSKCCPDISREAQKREPAHAALYSLSHFQGAKERMHILRHDLSVSRELAHCLKSLKTPINVSTSNFWPDVSRKVQKKGQHTLHSTQATYR